MPKINVDDSQLYGVVANDPALSFRERLMARFAAHEWVRVINIDDEPFYWQYLPSHSETFEYTPDPMKITQRGSVEAYRLDPGDSEVLVGENAYVMIEALYKKLVAKKVVSKNGEAKAGVARSFNWTDGDMQEKIINDIYLGKENPTFRKDKVNNDVPVTPKIGQPDFNGGRLRKAE